MTAPAAIVAAARTQIGVPWAHQGRLWGEALDCLGLVICTARACGLVAPTFDVNGYSRSPDGSMTTLCRRYMTEIQALELGAVVEVATLHDPHHLAIVGDYVHGGFSVIHSSNAGRGRCVEHRLAWTSAFRMRGIYRLPGAEA